MKASELAGRHIGKKIITPHWGAREIVMITHKKNRTVVVRWRHPSGTNSSGKPTYSTGDTAFKPDVVVYVS